MISCGHVGYGLTGDWPHNEYSPIAGSLTAADVMGPDGVVYPDWTRAGIEGGIPQITGPYFEVGPPSGSGDTAAIKSKIVEAAAAGGGVVLLEAGTYILDRPLLITEDNIVLRGAGREKTLLSFEYTVDLKEAKWFQPASDGQTLNLEDPLELHFSGTDVASIEYKIDGVTLSDWSWTAPDGNHLYSNFRVLTNLVNAGHVVDGQSYTIEAIVTWSDASTTSVSRTFTVDASWRGAAGQRRYALGQSAIALHGDEWTGRGGYRWSVYETVPRGSDEILVLYNTSSGFPLSVGWIGQLRGTSSDAWDALVDNTGMPNTQLTQRFEVIAIRDAVDPGELTQPIPAGMAVKVVQADRPVRHRYVIGDNASGGMEPQLDASYFPIQNSGIEDLTLEQPENTTDAGYFDELFANGITMSLARNCWVDNVRVNAAGRNSIAIGGLDNEMRNCRFDGVWWTHVGQGTGYVGFSQSNDLLFENIVGQHLRHAPNAQFGANGNVFRNSVMLGADAQYHFGWAHDNLYENVVIDARRTLTDLLGDQGVRNGSYGYGIYGQNGHNDIHSPGAGPRNVVYACDTISANSAVYLGDATERFIAQHNRFRVTGNAPSMIVNDYVQDTYIKNNAFVLSKKDQPLLSMPINSALNPLSGAAYNSNTGNSGILVEDNKVYRVGTGSTIADGTGVATSSGNQWLSYEKLPDLPTTSYPSIYAWQKALPQITMTAPGAWDKGSVGTPVDLAVTVVGHEGAALSGYRVAWYVDGEFYANGAAVQWTPLRVGDSDIRVEVILSDGTVVPGTSRLMEIKSRANDLPVASDKIHLRWRADSQYVALDGSGLVIDWTDMDEGKVAERKGAGAYFIPPATLTENPETGPLWVANGIGDKPTLLFSAANDGLGYSRPKDDGLSIYQDQARTVFIVFEYSATSGGQIFGTSNNNRIAVANSGDSLNVRRDDTVLKDNWSASGIFTPSTPQILAVRGTDSQTDAFLGGASVATTSGAYFGYEFDSQSFLLGACGFYGRGYEGELAEVIVFNEALTDTEITDISAALSTYYSGTAASLPANFQANALSGGRALLTWTSATGADQVEIQRQAMDGVWETLALLDGAETNWADVNVLPGETYSYRMRSLSGTGDSAVTNTASVTVAGSSLVSSASALGIAFANAQPGEEIIIADGVHVDWGQVDLDTSGTKDAPIVIRSETPLGATFKGDAYLRVRGDYITVRGLRFESNTGTRVLHGVGANYLTVEHCSFRDYQVSQSQGPLRIESNFAGDGGDYALVRYNLFENITGVGLTLYLPDDANNIGGSIVEYNIFRNTDKFYDNGQEALALYTGGKNLNRPLNATVRYNLFDDWDGDAETITVKSGNNHIHDNSFAWNHGSLSLRREQGTIVERNRMIGTSTGISLTGSGHTIRRNLIYNYSFRGINGYASAILNPEPDLITMEAIQNSTIEYNSIIAGPDSTSSAMRFEKTALGGPAGNAIRYNIFSDAYNGADVPLLRFYDQDASDGYDGLSVNSFSNNLYWHNAGAYANPAGLEADATQADPDFALESAGTLNAASPAIDLRDPGSVDFDLYNDAVPEGLGWDHGAVEHRASGSSEGLLPPYPRKPELREAMALNAVITLWPDCKEGEATWVDLGDSEGVPVWYSYDFGDGTHYEGPESGYAHAWADAGEYLLKVSVRNSAGVVDEAIQCVTVATSGVVYPADAVIDLTKAPYSLDPTGQRDATAALQQALDDYDGDMLTRFILYLPDGTYRLSGNVSLDTHDGTANGGSGRGVVLMGQSESGVVLQLDDNSAAFQDPANPLPLLDFNESQAASGWQFVGFNINIFNLTIDVGSGNPGAIALDFCANNAGGLRDVTLKSSDPSYVGKYGLLLSTIPGPQLFKRVTVNGFDWGVYIHNIANYTSTAEGLNLRNCLQGGLYNQSHSITIRNMTTDHLGGPAIHNDHVDGLVTLLDGTFSNGPSGESAIVNAGFAYLRNVSSTGYAQALSSRGSVVTGSHLTEWFTDGGLSLFNDAPMTSLNLTIEETPEPALEDPSNWVSVTSYGANPGNWNDDSGGIQAAINAMVASEGPDAGKTTLYFPPAAPGAASGNRYTIDNTITIPPGIERIIGGFNVLHPRNAVVATEPMFRLTGSGDLLVIEQLFTGADSEPNPTPIFKNESDRDLVLRNIHVVEGQAYVNTGTGRLFLEDVSATSLRYWGGDPQPVASAIPQYDFGGQDVWARQLNVEQKDLNLLNDGGHLWILGMKNEEDGTQIKTINGGRTELLGGVLMPLDVDVGSDPAYVVEDSEFTAVIAGHQRSVLPTPIEAHAPTYEILVRETQGGVTQDLADGDVTTRRSYTNDQGDTPPVMVLYSSLRPQPSLQFESSGVSVGEAEGSVTLTVYRTGDASVPASVDFATTDSTATAGADYTANSGTLTWGAGDSASKIITINITDDGDAESDETFTVTLSEATGVSLGGMPVATVTIADDDSTGTLAWATSSYTARESVGSVELTIERTGGDNGVASVNFSTSNSTATDGADYTAASGTLSWSDGDTASKTITIQITDDGVGDPDETFTVTLSAASGASLGSPAVATVTIDERPSLIMNLTFDGGNLADSSPDALVLNGTVSYATDNNRSYAVFNGVDNVITAPIQRSFEDGITVTFWTRADSGINGMPKNAALGWAHQNGVDGFVLAPGWNNNQQRLFRMGAAGGINDEVSTPDNAAYLDTWVHWGFVKDPTAGTMLVYRNGQLFGSANGKTIVPAFEGHYSTGLGYSIGKLWSGYYKGGLDDYRIYDVPLDGAEMTTVFEDSLTVTQRWYYDNGLPFDGTGDGAEGADPDGDSVVNLLERALGSLPNDGSSVHWPSSEMINEEGSEYLAITYRRQIGGSGTTGVNYTINGMTYTVEYDTDLVDPWSSGDVTQVGSANDNGDGTETVTVRLNVRTGLISKQFIRLKITVQ